MTEQHTSPLFIPPSLAYLEGLNPPQRQAVQTVDCPLLVLSGAGTGKTRVLTARIAHIVASRLAFPSQILAVTFTNRASHEMRERINQLVGPVATGLWLGTFHALAAKILRIHAEKLEFTPYFTILDGDDQLRLVKQILKSRGLDEKEFPPRAVLSVIQRWKDRGLTPEQVANQGGTKDGLLPLYGVYQDELRRLNALDFGDLMLHCLTLFRLCPEVLRHYQAQFRYILVDEYQDTNVAQYLWLRLLAQGGANLCCVGDDDQSIYGWRGAEVGNILKFEVDFPSATVIRLEQNYRSTAHILGAASQLISHNKGRLGKTLWTERHGGEPVKICGLWDGDEEARYVADEIESCQRRGEGLSGVAVLVRAGFQTRAFEERFLHLGIPYRVVGGPRFYERQEIRDALAYLRLIAQPSDDLAFERIINVPKRGIGATTVQNLYHMARSQHMSLMESSRQIVQTDDLKAATRNALRTFVSHVDVWREKMESISAADLAKQVLEDSGYMRMWQSDTSPEAPGRLENIKEFITALNEFESLSGFLEHVSLVMENNTSVHEEMVSLMTLHSAKGLEFDTVFLAGWEEGLFPHPRSLSESGVSALEEERRLAYVGMTRGKTQVYITFAANRRIHNLWQTNSPSRFLDDLPVQHVDVVQASASWGKKHLRPSKTFYTQPKSQQFHVMDAEYFDEPPFLVGQRVFHTKFGYGRVERLEGQHLSVDFEHAGHKKVMASFVEKA